jgi:hypothetical protein
MIHFMTCIFLFLSSKSVPLFKKTQILFCNLFLIYLCLIGAREEYGAGVVEKKTA